MVQSGAQCIILLGRSGHLASAADLQLFASSEAQIWIIRADVSRGEEAAAAAGAATRIQRKLRGVIHAAGIQVIYQHFDGEHLINWHDQFIG